MVERAATPKVSRFRRRLIRATQALTTPLLPDDYVALINPLWSTRELQGQVVRIRPETPNAATVAIRPNFPWPGHRAGQYLRIGVELDGVRHWRAYTITSDPDHPEGLVSISVRYVESGRMSPFFTREAGPGSLVYLGEVEGRFTLPEPLPGRLLFISAGSGVTPIFSLLRELERRDALADVVHIHSERLRDEIMFRRIFDKMSERHRGYRRSEHLSSEKGRISPRDLDALCPDWRERETFLSGPPEMLATMSEHWSAAGLRERLRMEHFQPYVGAGGGEPVGEGGTVRFRVTDFEARCDGATSMLVAGEEAGAELTYGCRMGVCHTCICKLVSGRVRDLRSGEVHGEPGEMIRICINAPEGHVELDEGRVVMTGTKTRSKR
jgi:stearoyl-CoA 9-desaturase NADPH oxidoreductase